MSPGKRVSSSQPPLNFQHPYLDNKLARKPQKRELGIVDLFVFKMFGCFTPDDLPPPNPDAPVYQPPPLSPSHQHHSHPHHRNSTPASTSSAHPHLHPHSHSTARHAPSTASSSSASSQPSAGTASNNHKQITPSHSHSHLHQRPHSHPLDEASSNPDGLTDNPSSSSPLPHDRGISNNKDASTAVDSVSSLNDTLTDMSFSTSSYHPSSSQPPPPPLTPPQDQQPQSPQSPQPPQLPSATTSSLPPTSPSPSSSAAATTTGASANANYPPTPLVTVSPPPVPQTRRRSLRPDVRVLRRHSSSAWPEKMPDHASRVAVERTQFVEQRAEERARRLEEERRQQQDVPQSSRRHGHAPSRGSSSNSHASNSPTMSASSNKMSHSRIPSISSIDRMFDRDVREDGDGPVLSTDRATGELATADSGTAAVAGPVAGRVSRLSAMFEQQ